MKFLTGILALVLTLSTLTYSRRSQAAVGLIMVNPAVILGGLAMAGTGAGALVIFQNASADTEVLAGVGGLLALIGVIVLDGEEGQKVSFRELTPKTAHQVGVTESERLNYNSELDQVNFILSEVESDMAKMKKPTAQDSQKVWSQYKDMVSSKTFSAMTKISTKSLKK
jgi:hypothetical protein